MEENCAALDNKVHVCLCLVETNHFFVHFEGFWSGQLHNRHQESFRDLRKVRPPVFVKHVEQLVGDFNFHALLVLADVRLD